MEGEINLTKNEAEKRLIKEGLSSDFITLIKMIGDITNKVINKPTSIEKVFPLSYVLKKNSLNDIYATIDDKLGIDKSEDKYFELNIHYDDTTFEKFPSIESFLNSHETQPKCAQSVSMIWKAKLYFGGRNNPLTQEIGEQHKIEITFSTPPNDSEDADRVFYMFNQQPIEGFGIVHVKIQHSNKIWAVEVIKHIEDFLKRIELNNKGLKKFLFINRAKVGKTAEKTINLTPLIPLIILLYQVFSNQNVIKNNIVIISTFSFIFFILTNIFSYTVGRFLYKTLSKLRPRSMIIVNEYSDNLCNQKQITNVLIFQIFLIIIIPIMLNVLSAWVSIKFGIK